MSKIWARARLSAIIGGAIWLPGLAALPSAGTIGLIERLLALAALVVVPLALPFVEPPERSRMLYRAAVMVQPVAGALAALAFFLPPGLPAALLAAGWLGLTGLVALLGVARLLARGIGRIDESCIDAGLIYLPVGGAWLLAARLGLRPLGFGDTIVLLTAAHFHYAGFAAPILAGLAGRRLRLVRPALEGVFRMCAVGIIVGIPLVAAGITFSRALEVVAALLLAASLLTFALLMLLGIVPVIRPRAVQALLAVSAGSIVATMVFAIAYAAGNFAGVSLITIQRMVIVHGWVNALGFVLCGLLAWNMLGLDWA